MFNSKKTKENLEKTQELYDSCLGAVKETRKVSDSTFTLLEAGDTRIEKNMEDLTDALQEQSAAWNHLNDKAAIIYSKMETLEEIEKKRQEKGEALKDSVDKLKKAVDFTGDINTRCQQMDELEEKSSANWEKQFEDCSAQIEKMQDASSNMTVLALNAAVEAGKLGGIGKDFLQAAEEVRQLAENYNHMLSDLTAKIQELKEFSNKEKELRKVILNGLHKKLEGTDSWREEIAATELDMREDIKIFKEQVLASKAMADGLREACEDNETMQRKLEAVTESSEENRKAANELKAQLTKMYEKVLDEG